MQENVIENFHIWKFIRNFANRNTMEHPKFNIILLKEADKFLSKIDGKTKQKIILNMDLARHTLNSDLLKRLTGDIWEFRTLYKGKQYRMLAFWDKQNKIDTLVVATHGFIKKVSKVPQTEIHKAEQIMKRYFNT